MLSGKYSEYDGESGRVKTGQFQTETLPLAHYSIVETGFAKNILLCAMPPGRESVSKYSPTRISRCIYATENQREN